MAAYDDSHDRSHIEALLRSAGLAADKWETNEDDDRIEARLKGTWIVINEDEDRSLYEDDSGTLAASCVGAIEYRNLRAAFFFTPEGMDCSVEVVPFDDVDRL